MTIKNLISPILIFSLFIPSAVGAITDPFNPSFIISDEQMQDHTSMTRVEVQNFLNEKSSYLATYTTTDTNGLLKKAADIIYEAAIKSKVNPKYLLVLLQREQSLITDKTPSQKQLDWAAGYAVCDGCYLNDPKVQAHRGFGLQVNDAAEVMRWYYDNRYTNSIVKQMGKNITIDSTAVTPQSWATAFLYTYTPHLHGNENFYKIWNKWFVQELFPNGTLVRSTLMENNYYLIQDGQKRLFKNKTILLSRANPDSAIPMNNDDLSAYPDGPDIAFSNYSLLKSGNTTYLVDYDTIRPFESAAIVSYFGYNPQEMIEVTSSDLSGYKTGTTITKNTIAPQGIIYNVTDIGAYYLLKDNILYPISSKTIITANYQNLIQEKHLAKDLNKFEVATEPIKFKDGTLIQETDSKKIYVIENGKKRKIKDLASAIAMGYKKSNLVKIDMLTALGIQNGEAFSIENKAVSDTQVAGSKIENTAPASVSVVSEAKTTYTYDTSAVQDLFKTEVPSYLVAEYPSGKILAGKDIDTIRPIASLTKLLTASTAINQGFNLKETTTYYKARHANYGNPLKLTDGEQLKNLDAFNSLLIASVNPVARMIAQSKTTEDKFIAQMNAQLKSWDLKKSKVADVSGLSEKNVSTARELLMIFAKSIQIPEIKNVLGVVETEIVKLSMTDTSPITIKNTNHLALTNQTGFKILAGKTGYTEEAQSVLVQLIEDTDSGKQFVTVTMGNIDYLHRFDEPQRLSEWTVKNY